MKSYMTTLKNRANATEYHSKMRSLKLFETQLLQSQLRQGVGIRNSKPRTTSPMPAKNRRTKKKLNGGRPQACEACGVYTHWFVYPVASANPPSWYTICLDCYQENQWQTRIATKETTTKGVRQLSKSWAQAKRQPLRRTRRRIPGDIWKLDDWNWWSK